jgi:hypothetical protein
LTSGSDEQQVVVRIFEPIPNDGHTEYACACQIIGLEAPAIPVIIGIDGIQALELALAVAGAVLYSSQAFLDGNLRWLDDSGDLGFPRPGASMEVASIPLQALKAES